MSQPLTAMFTNYFTIKLLGSSDLECMIIFGWTPSPATNSYQNLRVYVTDYIILSHQSSLIAYLPLIYFYNKNLILSSSIPSFRDNSLLLYNIQLTQKPRYNK